MNREFLLSTFLGLGHGHYPVRSSPFIFLRLGRGTFAKDSFKVLQVTTEGFKNVFTRSKTFDGFF